MNGKPDDTEQMRLKQEALLAEYKLAQEMHMYYGKVLWQLGSILLGAGLAGFFYSIQLELSAEQFFFIIIGLSGLIGGFTLSFIRHKNLAHFYISCCRELEEELGLKIKQHTLKFAIDKGKDECDLEKDKEEHFVGHSKFTKPPFTGKDVNKYFIPIPILAMYWGYFIFTYFKDIEEFFESFAF